MTLGQRIQQLRTKMGMSQEALGEKLGTSRQTVSKWELDQTVPEIVKIVQLSKLFSVTTDSLLVEGISTFDTPWEQHVCGVYKSRLLEIVETEKFALLFYCSKDGMCFGTKLYMGMEEKKLCAVCDYHQAGKRIVYAYKTEQGNICSNDTETEKELGAVYDRAQTKALKRTEVFFVRHKNMELPGVRDVGVKNCLALWRMSDSYHADSEQMSFTLCTGKTDYVFQISPLDTNIYCGISFQVPFEMGIMGGRQFFRIRNYGDNSYPWCRFFCRLGCEYNEVDVPVEKCELGKTVCTEDGYLLWGLKRYTDDTIVLEGCGGDEYIYRKDAEREEQFSPMPD